MTFIDQYRDRYGVEPICKELPIAPSTYHDHKILEQHPERRSTRAKRDEQMKLDIQRVWEDNHRNYGARKVWKQLMRESLPAARCTVERLMKQLGIEGVRRGKRCITTIPSESACKPLDLVNREFSADWLRQDLMCQLAVSVILTITRWQKPSMVFTRRRSFTKMALGVGLRMWSEQH